MNPSASGWIKKLLSIIPQSEILKVSTPEFYKHLKKTGFIYGSNVKCICPNTENNDFIEEERCKVNLLSTFYHIHYKAQTDKPFVESVVAFYKSTYKQKRSFLSDLFGEPDADKFLEKIIHKRIHIDDNVITKNFNYFLINAFLFNDIIGYKHYLTSSDDTKIYINKFETTLEHIVFTLLNSKTNKTKYDFNLIKLFEASLRQKKTRHIKENSITQNITTQLEKLYIVDTLCMASWSDKQIDKAEYLYLNDLRIALNIETTILIKAVEDINVFYQENKDKITFLSAKNLAQSFYDNSSNIVKRLIKRNSKRLINELSQSKDAMYLLSQSTTRNLTEEEQKQVQNQLLDIFKSIPSLAIFMLPGGMLLLPLFVKFIPTLLPSSFDENRIDKEKTKP